MKYKQVEKLIRILSEKEQMLDVSAQDLDKTDLLATIRRSIF